VQGTQQRMYGVRQTGGGAARDVLKVVKDLKTPTLRPRDLLVRVQAVALNPVDVKCRLSGNTRGLVQHRSFSNSVST
jgi:NADPH:quinone reductase-like Zn-dependent oxidoreductase